MYRQVLTTIWRDPKIRALPRDGKFLFAYLLTNQHTHLCGIYHLPDSVVIADTLIANPELQTLWQILGQANIAVRDFATGEVFVTNFFEHQGHGPKAALAAAKRLPSVMSEGLAKLFLKRYPDLHQYADRHFLDTLSDTPCDTLSDRASDTTLRHTLSDTPLQEQGTGNSFAQCGRENHV